MMNATFDLFPPGTAGELPFGTAWLPDTGQGVDLTDHGYVEEEYLIQGTAREWSYDGDGKAVAVAAHPYSTRALVRRPRDASRASGAVHLEPLHPHLDTAPTWASLFPWMLREGHVWVGVTQDAAMAGRLRDMFPQRYGSVELPVSGLGYDLLGQVATALHSGVVPDVRADRVILSGWSATGSFCRVYLQDGFHQRHRLSDGRPAVDGVVIGISSGAAGGAGYPPLSASCPILAPGDARRTIQGSDIPVFEILSEFESETHGASLREDGDAAGDRYRLYQIAGTAHTTLGEDPLTNDAQFERTGASLPGRQIVERRSDARMAYISRALFALLDGWITGGSVPPRASRFSFARTPAAPGSPTPLVVDTRGNVLGGIRSPWVDVPLSTYRPHSTPAPGSCRPPSWAPMGNPEQVAAMIGHATPLPEQTIDALYQSRDDYLRRFAQSTRGLLDQGYLLMPEAEKLIAGAGERWDKRRRP